MEVTSQGSAVEKFTMGRETQPPTLLQRDKRDTGKAELRPPTVGMAVWHRPLSQPRLGQRVSYKS